MAPITVSVEISKTPEEVFAYVTDPTHLPEWQESAVSVGEHASPVAAGSKVVVKRRAGPREIDTTNEIVELIPPTSWAIRGIDGPVRGTVNGRIEPMDDGTRSRVTIVIDFDGHGLGKLLVPLIVNRQVAKEMPRNLQRLKERLEGSG